MTSVRSQLRPAWGPGARGRPCLAALLPGSLVATLLMVVLVSSACFAAPKRIYIANDDHTDYMWSGDDAQYRSAFLTMLDYYMNQSTSTASNPSDSRGRFNMDGSVWLWEFERNRSKAQVDQLISHLRAGDLSMPLNVAVLCYGGMPAEAVLRSMYYAGRVERRENLRFPLVAAMENQTMPGGLASLWAGAGAKYSWRGVCGCVSRTPWGDRPREIYHFDGPDGQSVCMKWNTLRGSSPTTIGGYAEASDPSAAVSYLDGDSTFLAHWPWESSAAFGYGGDALQTTTGAFVSTAQSQSNATRRVIVSNETDFFEDFLGAHSGDIPRFSGSFGNEWDLYIASMGEVTADFRRTIEKLRTAEALATVASVHDSSFMNGRTASRDSAFLAAGMFYEHNWTGDGPVTRTRRAQWQRQLLAALHHYVDPLHAGGLAALGALVAQPGGSERYVVFNPLSWALDAAADLPSTLAPPLHVVEVAGGQEVPSQVMGSGAAQVVRILASGVPSVGYKTYEVRAGAGASFPAAAAVSGATIDNGIYAVTLGSAGNLTSILDRKDGNRQLVDVANGSVHSLGSGAGTVSVESSGPVSTTLRVVAGGTPSHETRVTLYAGLDRIDLEGLVTQNFSVNVAYSSAFNLAGCTMRHEEVGMIAKVARAAQGGDYADQNTRTDWLSFGHFADLSTATRGVTISNWDSPFFQPGNSDIATLDGSTPLIKACVGMQVDGPNLGMPDQGGDTRFLNRFSLRTHGAYDAAGAMRFALEHQNPLVATRVSGSAASALPATTWSMLALPSNDVLLWALKPAEEGIDRGVIARVWNVADGARSMSLSLPAFGIAQASRATHIETDLEPASLSAGVLVENLARQQMRTLRVFPGTGPRATARIQSPVDGAFFVAGDVITLSGSVGGTPDTTGVTVRWEVDRFDGDSLTAGHFVFTTLTAAFTAEDPSAGTLLRYAIRLIVSAADGTRDTATVRIDPEVDLAPAAAVTVPDPVTTFGDALYRFTIRNHGRSPVPHARWMLLANGVALAAGDTALAGADSVTIERQLGPAPAPGSNLLRAVVDSLDELRETDETNNGATRTLVVIGPRDTVPPTFTTGPTVTADSSAVVVRWVTDEPSRGAVRYGIATAAGDSALSGRATSHAVTLSRLLRGRRYFYQVAATDDSGHTALSPPDSFTTLPNRTPVPVASGTPLLGQAPLAVQFSSDGSSDADGDSLGYAWSFGDGQGGSGADVSHVYVAAGHYSAVLTVDDGNGGTASATVVVRVSGPPAFPTTPVVDSFNRADGPMGVSWSGQTSRLAIRSNALQPSSSAYATVSWNGAVFGPDQEAYVTFGAITSSAPEHDVLLKMQGTGASSAHIEVRYDATVSRIYVGTYAPAEGWRTWSTVPVTLAAEDKLGARAYANGDVEVYRNSVRLAAVSVAGWAYATQGGRIGLTVSGASSSRLDDFGGGNMVASDITPPQFISGPAVTVEQASVVVLWMTDEAALGAVRYGQSEVLGDSATSVPGTTGMVTLTGLARAARYYYQVGVTDAAGNTTLSARDSFATPPNRAPVAVAGGTPLSGVVPLTVQFSGAGSSDADGDSLSLAWSFGDGQGGSGASVSHTYLVAGSYSAVLMVDDGYQGTTFDTLAVEVSENVLAVGAPRHVFSFRGAEPNPARRGGLFVWFSLPDDSPATIEVFDISGRCVERREVGALGAGQHRIDLARGADRAAGVYLVRLIRGRQSITRRAVLLN